MGYQRRVHGQLDKDTLTAVEVKSGTDQGEHFSPGSAVTTSREEDGKETRILMKIRTNQILSKSLQGQQLKTSFLRLFVLDNSVNDILVCKIIRPWTASEVTWISKPAFDGPKSNCLSTKAPKKNEWVTIDISEWMRDWISSPSTNYGITIIPTGTDGVGFVSYLDPDTNQRPRLSLSCHGDNFDTTHSASNKFVFRETRSKLVSERKKKVTKAQKTRKTPKKTKNKKTKTEKNSLPRRLRRTKAPKKKIDHKAKVQEKRKKPVEENSHPKYVDSDGWVVSNASSYKDVEEHEKRKIAEKEERKKAEEKDKEEKKKDKIREQKEKKEMEKTKKNMRNIKNHWRKRKRKRPQQLQN